MEDRTISDNQGNRLKLTAGELVLELPKLGKRCLIGRIYTEEDRKVLVTIRNSQKHLFRKMDAYGFNYHMLTELGIDLVKVIEDKVNIYLVPVSVINQIGKVDVLNFSRQGFELQRFISRDELQKFRIQ